MANVKKSITVADLGKHLDPKRGHAYKVIKAQNTLEVRMDQIMDDEDVQCQINQGVTVNIEPLKR